MRAVGMMWTKGAEQSSELLVPVPRRSAPGAAEQRTRPTGNGAVAVVVIDDNRPVMLAGVMSSLRAAGLEAVPANGSERPQPTSPTVGAVVVNVRSTNDIGRLDRWAAVAPVLALAAEVEPERRLRSSALAAGACAAIADDEDGEVLAATVADVLGGLPVPPFGLTEMPAVDELRRAAQLDDLQLELVRRLVAGERVAAIAAAVNRSERDVHRRLRKLYRRAEVAGHDEVIAWALRVGIVDGPANAPYQTPRLG